MQSPDSLTANCVSVRLHRKTQEKIKIIAINENRAQSQVIRQILEAATNK